MISYICIYITIYTYTNIDLNRSLKNCSQKLEEARCGRGSSAQRRHAARATRCVAPRAAWRRAARGHIVSMALACTWLSLSLSLSLSLYIYIYI